MIYVSLMILLLAAVACFGLSRALPTRLVGVLAAAAALAAAALLFVAPTGPFAQPLVVALPEPLRLLDPTLGGWAFLLAVALLGGGALALLGLALLLAAGVRGFGGLFAWALVALAAGTATLAAPPNPFVTPLAWSVVALASYAAVRVSGALNRDEHVPLGLAIQLAAVVLLAGLVGALPTQAGAQPLGWGSALVLLVSVLAFSGALPFHHAIDEAVAAPAPLGALIYGLLLPIVALSLPLRLLALGPLLPPSWNALLALVGALTVLAAGAGALNERRLRPLLGWQTQVQLGLALVGLAMPWPAAALVVTTLLVSLAAAAVLGATAAALVEQTTGSDDFTQLQTRAGLDGAGIYWVLAAAAALGLPPLFGFWARNHLFVLLAGSELRWALPPIFAGSLLLALALVAPLARFWAGRGRGARNESIGLGIVGALALAALLTGGLVPGAAWYGRADQAALASLAPEPLTSWVGGGALVVGLILLGLFWRTRWARAPLDDPDMLPVALPPEVLGAQLAPLSALARPARLLARFGGALVGFSGLLQRLVSLFEQRFYLFAVLAALISIMLLMAQ